MMIDANAQVLDFVDCTDSNGAIKVIPDLQQGGMALRLGQGFDAGSPVKSWLIINASTGPVSGTVVLSDAGFRNFRMFGNVNVIDNGVARSLANTTFIGAAGVTGIAGNFSQVQLWNPPGNAKNVVLQTIYANSAAVGYAQIRPSSVALATSAGGGGSKNINAAGSTAQLRTQQSAALVGGQSLGGGALQAGANFVFSLREPIVITPGNGLTINGAIGQDMSAVFEFFEQ